jgi:hypothetical protein
MLALTVRTLAAGRDLLPLSLRWTPLLVALGAFLGAAVAFEPRLTVLALAALCVGVVIFARPDFATPLTIGLIYSNAFVVGAQFHGLPYVLPALLPALLVLPLGYRLLVRREPVVVTPALPLLALYLVVQLVSALASGDAAGSTEEVNLFATQGFLLYIALTNALHNVQMVRVATWTIVIVGAMMASISVFQQVTNTFENEYFGFAQTGTVGLSRSVGLSDESGQTVNVTEYRQARASGPIGEKNRYAQVLIVLIPLGLYRFWGEPSRLLRVIALSATAVITFGVLLSFSRGAFVGFVGVLAAMVVLRCLSVRQMALIGLAVVLFAVALPTYVVRLTSLEGIEQAASGPGQTETDPVLQQRANDVLAAVLIFYENPVLGIGPGRFTTVYRDYAPRVGGIPGDGDYAAHSLFPGIAAESGALGVAVLGGILLVTLWELARARSVLRDKRPDLVNLATGYLLAIVAYLGTSVALHMSFQRYFWILMALAAATAYVALREARALEAAGQSAKLPALSRQPELAAVR